MKPQWKEVTDKILQIPVNQKDFIGCLFMYEKTPLFRIGWAFAHLAAIHTGEQVMHVTSATMNDAPPFKFTIHNGGFRCFVKVGVGTPPSSGLIMPN